MVDEYAIPDVYESEINALIRVSHYRNKSEIINDALRLLFNTTPNLKIDAAIQMYENEDVTLNRAAELAGMNTIEFKETLKNKGISIKVPERTKEELKRQLEVIDERRVHQ